MWHLTQSDKNSMTVHQSIPIIGKNNLLHKPKKRYPRKYPNCSCPISLGHLGHVSSHSTNLGQNFLFENWPESNQQREMYRQHRKRVQNAKSIVNSHAPRRQQADFEDHVPTFMELMESLCRHSHSRTFTKAPESGLHRSKHSLKNNLSEHSPESPFKSTEKNYKCTKKLHKTCKKLSLRETNKRESRLNIPEHVLQRYQHLYKHIERDQGILRRLLRPQIYFDLEVKGIRPLGRIVIQLFTEACPAVVVEFVRTCMQQNDKNFTITRLFPPLWLEGVLALDYSYSFALPNIEHDTEVLDHGSSSGILSFPSRYVRGNHCNYLSFSISFRPISVLNGKRIAFGRVRRGLSILETIQDYGTYNGKPRHDILIKRCGLLHR